MPLGGRPTFARPSPLWAATRRLLVARCDDLADDRGGTSAAQHDGDEERPEEEWCGDHSHALFHVARLVGSADSLSTAVRTDEDQEDPSPNDREACGVSGSRPPRGALLPDTRGEA